MEMRTYTSVWRMVRRVAHIRGMKLPVQWTLGTIVMWIVAQIGWTAALLAVGFTPGLATFAIWAGPPALLAWWADRTVIDGRSVIASLTARLGWLAQPRTLQRIRPAVQTRPLRSEPTLWRRNR